MNVRLDNGVEVSIRPIRPDDKPRLTAIFARLSAETAYRRFLAPKKRLSPAELGYLTEVDFVDHVAFVAVLAEEPERLVGVARWVRGRDDPASAEFAFLVSDAVQGHGLGTALAEALVDAARARGVRRFVATTLPHNAAAHRLLTHLGTDVTTQVVGGMHEVRGELAPARRGRARRTALSGPAAAA